MKFLTFANTQTNNKSRRSFTLIELLVVLALVAILSVVVILTLNPAELIKQARDSNRLSDLSTINTALNLFSADVTSGFMGTSTVVYVSIPSTSPTCSGVGLPTLPATYTYNCVTAANLRNTNGTGWIPVNFQRISSNSPISQLPIDPINTTSTNLYYTYVSGGSWELNATIEAAKNKLGGSGDLVSKDGGSATSQYEIGNNLNLSPLETGDTSLVGYWNFEEGANATSSDRSGYGNHGTWYGTGTHYVGGKTGVYAAQFNGSDDYVSSGNNSSMNFGSNPFSVSFWMKPAGGGSSLQILASKMAGASWNSIGWHIRYNGTALFFYLDNGSADNYGGPTYSPSAAQWHHVVGVRNGTAASLYVDGQMVDSLTNSIYGGDISGSLGQKLGWESGWGSFVGLLDDARLYSRALSATEVLALYDATK